MTMDTYKVSVTTTASPRQYRAQVRDFTLDLASDNQNRAGAYETILEALGACESIVMGSFYKKQEFHYQSFYYTLEGRQDTQSPRLGLDEIGVGVHFKTQETKKACQSFVDFAEATCPVMDNLTNTVPIKRTSVTVD